MSEESIGSGVVGSEMIGPEVTEIDFAEAYKTIALDLFGQWALTGDEETLRQGLSMKQREWRIRRKVDPSLDVPSPDYTLLEKVLAGISQSDSPLDE